MAYTVSAADAYVRAHRSEVDPAYRPAFHLCAPVGWINDPNGFCFYKGKYHLFAQFHPYDSVWGPMHWAHWTSEDLTHWEEQPTALAPDSPFDDMGCFSGTALEHDGRLVILYTGVHQDPDGSWIQEQCLAWSDDGITFTKYAGNPVIGRALLPEDGDPRDFRDPKLIRTEDGWRAACANKGKNGGRVLTFRSKDLTRWEYEGVLMDGIGEMAECPDYMTMDDDPALIASVYRLGRQEEGFRAADHDVIYATGEEQDGALVPRVTASVDFGPDFYAPQTLLTPDGRRVMIGWMGSCGGNCPTHVLGHRWQGVLTAPRELVAMSWRIYQRPAREVEALFEDALKVPYLAVRGETRLQGARARRYELKTQFTVPYGETGEIRLLESGEEYLALRWSPETRVFELDRSRCGDPADGVTRAKLTYGGESIALTVLADSCVVEVLVNDGLIAMTALVYPKGSADGISFAGRALVSDLMLRTFKE